MRDRRHQRRTMPFNQTQDWDVEIVKAVQHPRGRMLPRVAGHRRPHRVFEAGHPGPQRAATAIAGDREAALFGQACLSPAMQEHPPWHRLLHADERGELPEAREFVCHHGLAPWGKACYALEGSVRSPPGPPSRKPDELGILTYAADSQALALSVPDTQGLPSARLHRPGGRPSGTCTPGRPGGPHLGRRQGPYRWAAPRPSPISRTICCP